MFESTREAPGSFPGYVCVGRTSACIVVADHVAVVSPDALEAFNETVCVVSLIHLFNRRSRKHLTQINGKASENEFESHEGQFSLYEIGSIETVEAVSPENSHLSRQNRVAFLI